MTNQLKQQTENFKRLDAFAGGLEKFLDNRNWSEIGFYIFAGFLGGLIVGSLIAVVICWIQHQSNIPEKVNPQIPMAIIEQQQGEGSTSTFRESSVI
jgi:hypothetical protein